MNIDRTAQVSPYLAAQKNAVAVEMATVKLANNNIKQQGQAMLELINSVPQPTQSLGNFVNVKV
jgi:hypothetical protein